MRICVVRKSVGAQLAQRLRRQPLEHGLSLVRAQLAQRRSCFDWM